MYYRVSVTPFARERKRYGSQTPQADASFRRTTETRTRITHGPGVRIARLSIATRRASEAKWSYGPRWRFGLV